MRSDLFKAILILGWLLLLCSVASAQRRIQPHWVEVAFGEAEEDLRKHDVPVELPTVDGHLAPMVLLTVGSQSSIWVVLPRSRGEEEAKAVADRIVCRLSGCDDDVQMGGEKTALARKFFSYEPRRIGGGVEWDVPVGALAQRVRAEIGPEAWVWVRSKRGTTKPFLQHADKIPPNASWVAKTTFGFEGALAMVMVLGIGAVVFAGTLWGVLAKKPGPTPKPATRKRAILSVLASSVVLIFLSFLFRNVDDGVDQMTARFGNGPFWTMGALILISAILGVGHTIRQSDGAFRRRLAKMWSFAVVCAIASGGAVWTMVRMDSPWFYIALLAAFCFAMTALSFAFRPFSPQHSKDGQWEEVVRRLCAKGKVRFGGLRILETSDVGATVSFGGCITLTRGLIERFPQDEVKAVIAHEIGHLRRRDPLLSGLVIYGGGSLLAIVLLLGMAKIGAKTNSLGYPIFMVSAGVMSILLSRRRHRGEFAADRFASELVGDPDLVARALLRLRSSSVPEAVSTSLTHPALDERIERLRGTSLEPKGNASGSKEEVGAIQPGNSK